MSMTREGVCSPLFLIYHSCHPGMPAKTRLDSQMCCQGLHWSVHPLYPWGPHVTPLRVGPAHIGSPCDPYGVPVWPIARSALLHSHDPNLYHMGANCQHIFNEITISETHYNFRSPKLMKSMVNKKNGQRSFHRTKQFAVHCFTIQMQNPTLRQSCEMSQIWQIYLCKNIEKLG